MRISTIKIGRRYRKDMGDISSLAENIRNIGLLHPVVVRPDGTLVAGERRIQAFNLLGRADIPVTVLDIEALARGELVENTARKDFSPSELVEISREVEDEERRIAKARQAESARRNQPQATSERGNFPPSDSVGKTRDRVAARVGGASGRTLEKARAIVEAAEEQPEVFGKLVEDMDRTGRVDGPFKRLKVIKQAEVIRAAPAALPTGPFSVIVIDPPWPYELRKADPSHRATHPYPQMSLAQICAMPIAGMAADNCILWLWTTNHHMREAVINALVGLGGSGLAVVGGLFALYIGYKFWQRQRLLSELRMARITVDELRQMQEAGENPLILDLRSHLELDQDPALIRGAIHLAIDDVELRHQEIPRDRDIILYCSCPNEVSSARVALRLHRKGIVRVRPLSGGIDAWRERNYPTEPHVSGRSAFDVGSGGRKQPAQEKS